MAASGASDPDARSDEWLSAHNSRRAAYFKERGVSNVDLHWSTDLSHSAQGYADKLIGLEGCKIMHRYENDIYGGENLYMQWTSAPPDQAAHHTAEEALLGWYEGEKDLPFGDNGHFTQVVWRPSHYVGCGMQKKEHNGGTCFIDVCRYIVPGNCGVDAGTWEAKVIEDKSLCAPECPKEGCFAASSQSTEVAAALSFASELNAADSDGGAR